MDRFHNAGRRRRGCTGTGLSRQAEQPSLFLWDVIAASPNRFLDRAFVQAYVCHCGVLLKLLDTAERLNVQVHPDRFAARRL